jgi:hypothetical protein
MPITQLQRNRTIALSIDTSNQDNMIVAYQPTSLIIGSDFLPGYKLVSYNVFLKNYRAYASIKSLEEIALPVFELTDSETDKRDKILNTQWQSPRIHLDLLITNNNGNNWHQVGSIALYNPGGYPYQVYALFDLLTDNLIFELGQDSWLGIQVVNVGFGKLTNTDTITIHGSYTEELFLESKEPPINITVNVTGTAGNGNSPTSDRTISNQTTIDNEFTVGN